MKDTVISIVIANQSLVEIKYNSRTEKIMLSTSGEEIDSNYVMLVGITIECLKALAKNIPLNRYFNPLERAKTTFKKICTDREKHEFYKFKWNKTGILYPIGWTSKRYQHATTVEEALTRNRVFTCDEAICSKIPTRREQSKVDATGVPSSGKVEATVGSFTLNEADNIMSALEKEDENAG